MVNLLDSNNFLVSLSARRIFSIKIKAFKALTLDDVIRVSQCIDNYYKAHQRLKPGVNLLEFGYGSTIDSDARKFASTPSANQHTRGTAILVKSKAQQIVGDYYLRFNKPRYPTKVYYDKRKALSWVKKQIVDIDQLSIYSA